MKADAKTDVASEVAQRLDDLFTDGSEPKTALPHTEDPPAESASPLAELNAIVLSIDWEITGEIMQRCIDETERLKGIFTGDPVVFKLLQILGSVARYVNSRKAASHPEAITLLHSVFDSLAASIAFGDGTRADKNDLLAKEATRFKALKAKIQANQDRRSAICPEPVEPVPAPQPPPAAKQPPAVEAETDPVLAAIADLKQVIQAEFAALRRHLTGGARNV